MRRKTSRYRKERPERRLHLKVSSPRIVCFECLRFFKGSLRLILLLGLLGAAGWGAREGLHHFFIENEEFQLSQVNLETNGSMTAEHFARLTQIDLESSVFALKLSELKEKLLSRPGVLEASLHRRLPGTLKVEVTERVPIAWLECKPLGIVGRDPKTGLLLDQGGVCFPCEFWWEEEARALPVVVVGQAREGDVTIGKPLRHHGGRRALALIKLAQATLQERWSLEVVAVERDYSLLGATSEGVMAYFGMFDHERQLGDLARLVRHSRETGEVIDSVNLIPKKNIPVIARLPGVEDTSFLSESRLERDIRAVLERK